MKIETSLDNSSIVLVGAFNPRIFHPSWLALNKVISSEQADEAKVTIVHEDITQFIAAYMSFDIQPKRFQVKCDTNYRDMLKDLVLSVFRDHLPHSLAWFLGINRSVTLLLRFGAHPQ